MQQLLALLAPTRKYMILNTRMTQNLPMTASAR